MDDQHAIPVIHGDASDRDLGPGEWADPDGGPVGQGRPHAVAAHVQKAGRPGSQRLGGHLGEGTRARCGWGGRHGGYRTWKVASPLALRPEILSVTVTCNR